MDNSWEFETVGRADYLMGSDNLTIKVSKELLGISENDFSFDFKWADNSTNIGNVMQFMDLATVHRMTDLTSDSQPRTFSTNQRH